MPHHPVHSLQIAAKNKNFVRLQFRDKLWCCSLLFHIYIITFRLQSYAFSFHIEFLIEHEFIIEPGLDGVASYGQPVLA